MSKPSPTGSSFAERAAATAGESSFTAPAVETVESQENSTFAERANAAKKAAPKSETEPEPKQVDGEVAEDKAVKKAPAKKAAKRS